MCSSRQIPLFLVLLLLCSCTVLEDRADCPCHLHMDFSDPANLVSDTLCVRLSSGAFSKTILLPSEKYSEGLIVTVPGHSGVNLTVFDNESRRYGSDGEIRIPVGEQCPHSYLFASFCDTSGPEAEAYVRVRKNYCGLSITFNSGDADNYEMKISGNVCGFGRDALPLSGAFSVAPAFDGSSVGSTRIPRQIDNSLVLSVTSDSGATRNFALGSYIVESGYDWTKADLDDIAVTIDYAATSVSISVGKWEKDISCEVLI